MNEPSGKRDDSDGSSRKWLLILLALVAGMIATVFVANLDPDGGPEGPGEDRNDGQLLDWTRTALAATENLETEEADQAWESIIGDTPDDRSAVLNRALNRVIRVDRLATAAMDASSDAEKQKAARMQLPTAIDAARSAIDDYERLSGDSVITLWLQSRIDLHYAQLLPSSMTRTSQIEVFDSLVAAISGPQGKSPLSIMLAGPLTDVLARLEDPSDGLPADVLADAAPALSELSDQNPDNLFLAIQAARLNIAIKHEQAADAVRRTETLSKSIEPTLSRSLKPIGYTAEQMVAKITTAIEEGKWDDADQGMQFWFNVLNPTEIVKTDRRRASPHPLDRLSFDALRRLSAEAVASDPVAKGEVEIRFDESEAPPVDSCRVIATCDFDIDLDDDLVTVSALGLVRMWENDGAGQWTPAGEFSLDMIPTGLLAVDLFMVDESHPERLKTSGNSPTNRHNAFPSLVAFGDDGIRILRVDGRSETAVADRLKPFDDAGLDGLKAITAVTAGDLEGDGDLDLVVATATGVRMFANRGNRTFFEIPAGNGFASDDPVGAMAIADLDRDLDLDIVTLHPVSGRVGQIENLLHLQFRSRILAEVPKIDGAAFLNIADVDANVSWDIVVGGTKQSAIVFSQTADAGAWTVDRVESVDRATTDGVVADFDNDSWSELFGRGDGLSISRLGPWGFDDGRSIESGPVAQMAAANINSDGLVDVIGLRGGQPVVMVNRTESPGHYLNVRFRGIADNAANSGRVNHFGIGSVLELRFGPHYRSRIITSPETHFGLGPFDKASSVRVILPNGLTQTIRDPAVDMLVEEEQKLKGSCPYLYAWDGEKFVFVTDCLWAAPLGLQVARGVVAKDRPWEYLKVDGRHIKPRGDHYEFRITEELWEVAYLDKLAMSAVDRPADVEVWTNEKVGPGEIATPTVFVFGKRDLHQLVRGTDNAGRDVTQQLLLQDRDFVQGFDRRLRQGLCPPHWIDLDFGDVKVGSEGVAGEPAVYLVLTGWILPTDTSLNIQIDQNPDLPAIEFPSVWVPDSSATDGWKKAIPYMGFPGGKTKTIVVDVTEAIRADDPRLRVRTSAQIYWDCAKLAVQPSPPKVNVQELDLISASVDFHGFSERTVVGPRRPETYDYQRAVRSAIWPPLRGGLSRFGNCLDEVRDWDDLMVVIGAGDEVRFRFSVPAEPVPEGWRRDFVLHCVGWDKDADLNTLAGQQTGPLPFRQMESYPPPIGDRDAALRVQKDHASRVNRHQSFRSFWYRGGTPEPSRFLEPPFGGSTMESP